LQPVLDALVVWGAQWAFGEPRPEELDPLLLLWWMRGGVRAERLPPRRIVIEFVFCNGAEAGRYWLLLDKEDRSICLKPPGFDTDVFVRADLAALYEVWLGRSTFAEALHDARIELDATPALMHAFPQWFALSPFAPAVQAASTRN
jgi:hypothetical protein